MAETITAIAVAVDAAFAATAQAVGNALIAVGVPTATAAAVATAVYVAAPNLAMAAASAALNYALTPPLPTPESAKRNFKQPIPPRVSGYGWYRLGGPFMLREAKKKAYTVVAFHDGRVAGFHRFWLNDDLVTLVGNVVQTTAEGSYGAGRVKIYTRAGLETETSYTVNEDFSELGADVWTPAHRGDGIASGFLRLQSVEREGFSNTYPAGAEIALSAEMQLQFVYDWRDDDQDIDDPETWAWSDNPFLCLAHYLCLAEGGPGYDWAETVAPFLASWTEAANVCDELVPLKAGGSEKRYRVNLLHQWDNAPTDVINNFLECCDGRIEEIDGGYKVWAGKHYAPTVTITEAHILSMSIDRFREDEEAINELRLSYTSRDHGYTPVDAGVWRNDADIEARGGKVRSEPFGPTGVFYNSQVCRLGKARMSRLCAGLRGVVVTDYFGMQALGEITLLLKFPKHPATDDIVVDVDPDAKITVDLTNKTVTIPWVLSDANRYTWDAATEEGAGPDAAPPVIGGGAPKPVIDSVLPFYESTGVGGEGVRLRAYLENPDGDGLSYALRWRVVGTVSWSQTTIGAVAPTGSPLMIELVTGFVPADEDVEVEAALINGSGGLSDWSDTVVADTSLAASPPLSPGGLSAIDNGSPTNGATVSWSNAGDVTHARVRYGGASDSFPGLGNSGDLAAAPGTAQSYNYLLSPGSYRIWVENKNAAGYGPPAGPATVTVV